VAKATAKPAATKVVAKKAPTKTAPAKKAPVKKAVAAKKAAPKSKTVAAPDARLVDFYREMLFIRRFEERAARAYTQALIGGYCHLNLGEEAAVVGLMSALEPTDYLFTNYREHGYAIARDIDPRAIMAELYGRVDGVSKGWGGSMHIFDLEHRLLGGYGIVGGQLPLATGAALAIDYRSGSEVVMCTMGEGTTNIGAFHESLNIAQLWHLPIVFVVINNFLGMGTKVEKSSSEPEIFRRGAAYRMPSARVDGIDPVAVAEAAKIAVDSARRGEPYLLEVTCHRLKGHSVVDPAKYRTPDEVEELKHHDPVAIMAEELLHLGLTDQASLEALNDAVMARVEEIAAFAEASAHPDVATLFDYTYASPVPNDSRRLPGQPLFPLSGDAQ
jgi:pyruvate dehydrogenase E1 component alpha subunit